MIKIEFLEPYISLVVPANFFVFQKWLNIRVSERKTKKKAR
jgi:hypothetical protein